MTVRMLLNLIIIVSSISRQKDPVRASSVRSDQTIRLTVSSRVLTSLSYSCLFTDSDRLKRPRRIQETSQPKNKKVAALQTLPTTTEMPSLCQGLAPVAEYRSELDRRCGAAPATSNAVSTRSRSTPSGTRESNCPGHGRPEKATRRAAAAARNGSRSASGTAVGRPCAQLPHTHL